MSETLAQHPPTTHDIVNLTAASLSAAPNLTEAERTARFQTVIRGVTEFHPTDPTQTVLASLILGHHLAIMDGFRDIACLTLTPTEAARARMVTVAQTKLVLQLARELRIARKEAHAQTAAGQSTTRPEPSPEPAGDAEYEAALAKLLSAYTGTLATLEATNPLTPAAAAEAKNALAHALTPGAQYRQSGPVEANSRQGTAAGSRGQRRAAMKRQAKLRRTA